MFLMHTVYFISVTSLDVSDDSSMLAAGLLDSTIKVWSINGGTLAAMKNADELDLLDKEAGKHKMINSIFNYKL